MVGLDGVGKTQLLYHWATGYFTDTVRCSNKCGSFALLTTTDLVGRWAGAHRDLQPGKSELRLQHDEDARV
jgi:GTPase SAR1 family protein